MDAEADRAFVRDALGMDHVDAGGGWLIFKLPPSELAFHPGDEGGATEFYLMCDDVEAEIARLTAMGRACEPIREEMWGRLTRVTLPGRRQAIDVPAEARDGARLGLRATGPHVSDGSVTMVAT